MSTNAADSAILDTTLNGIYSTSGIPITTAYIFNRDFTTEEQAQGIDDFEKDIQNIEKSNNIILDIEEVDATVTKKYNCHTYAWYGVCDWDEEIAVLISVLPIEKIETILAALPEEDLARITALLTPENEDEFLTE